MTGEDIDEIFDITERNDLGRDASEVVFTSSNYDSENDMELSNNEYQVWEEQRNSDISSDEKDVPLKWIVKKYTLVILNRSEREQLRTLVKKWPNQWTVKNLLLNLSICTANYRKYGK